MALRRNQRNDWQKNVLCRYFMNGLCAHGDDCSYSHDPTLSVRRTLPCVYYARGTCAYGDNCRFSHGQTIPPPPPPPSEENGVESSESTGEHDRETPYDRLHSPEMLETWAEAPEFVPSTFDSGVIAASEESLEKEQVPEVSKEDDKHQPKSWAHVVNPEAMARLTIQEAESQICPYGIVGECRYGDQCAYVHGEYCELCQQCLLHPHHEEQRRVHRLGCVEKHEIEMEIAFAYARSKDKTCGICMEVVVEKANGEARFGIMPSCNHCYCLSCLRKWRQSRHLENNVVRACPECRQTSDYICPSRYWVETEEEKGKLLSSYKKALNQKECKYFNKGQGECPFGNKCFYRHVAADGKDVDVGPPRNRPQRRLNTDGDFGLVQRLLLYDFLEEREGRLMLPFEYLEFLDVIISDSEDDLQ